jgi:hypothetical protein
VAVCEIVGPSVSNVVGDLVAPHVGPIAGETFGAEVGPTVGSEVGASVGPLVGDFVEKVRSICWHGRQIYRWTQLEMPSEPRWALRWETKSDSQWDS